MLKEGNWVREAKLSAVCKNALGCATLQCTEMRHGNLLWRYGASLSAFEMWLHRRCCVFHAETILLVFSWWQWHIGRKVLGAVACQKPSTYVFFQNFSSLPLILWAKHKAAVLEKPWPWQNYLVE